MISAKIGVAFIRKSYKFSNIKNVMDMMGIVFTDDFCSDNWFIDLTNLRQKLP